MRQSLVEIVSKVLTITSNKHSRINVVHSVVDTRDSPPLMCMLVLWGTVWQVHMFAKNLGRKVCGNFFLSGLQKLLEIVPLVIRAQFVHETSGTV
jgi:hypothetical protein